MRSMVTTYTPNVPYTPKAIILERFPIRSVEEFGNAGLEIANKSIKTMYLA